MAGCGKLAKGTHPKDDAVPCGTKLWFGRDKKAIIETIHLCKQCKEEQK
jgi:hypothetical protein